MIIKLFIIFLKIALTYSSYYYLDYQIEIEEIFFQKEDSYHVLFFQESCLSCQTIIDYIKTSKIYQKIDIFYIDLEKLDEEFLSFQNNNVGVNSYLDIKVNKSPTIFYIENKQVSFQEEGMTSIHNYLENITKF